MCKCVGDDDEEEEDEKECRKEDPEEPVYRTKKFRYRPGIPRKNFYRANPGSDSNGPNKDEEEEDEEEDDDEEEDGEVTQKHSICYYLFCCCIFRYFECTILTVLCCPCYLAKWCVKEALEGVKEQTKWCCRCCACLWITLAIVLTNLVGRGIIVHGTIEAPFYVVPAIWNAGSYFTPATPSPTSS
jgi:hypothetical protein